MISIISFSDKNSFILKLPNMSPYHVQFAASFRTEYNIYTGCDPLKLTKLDFICAGMGPTKGMAVQDRLEKGTPEM